MNDDDNNEIEYEEKTFNYYVAKYGGAVIGGVVGLFLCIIKLYMLILYVIIIAAGAMLGNYIQKNKIEVKEKIKSFIDKF